VSRLYLLKRPKVVVDFEPDPGEGKFYVDEKRRFFSTRGIIYVPIFLGERLTKEQFLERLHRERRVMEQGRKEAGEDAALVRARSGIPVQPASEILDLDRVALQRLNDEIGRNTHLRGASRAKRLAAIRRSLATP
jgi:hypothetical protein